MQDDLSSSEDTEDDSEVEESAKDGGEFEPLVRPCCPHTDSCPPDSPPSPFLSLITDTFQIRRPSFPSTDGTLTRSLPLTSPIGVGKSWKSYSMIHSKSG